MTPAVHARPQQQQQQQQQMSHVPSPYRIHANHANSPGAISKLTLLLWQISSLRLTVMYNS